MASSSHYDLNTRVGSWRQEVASAHKCQQQHPRRSTKTTTNAPTHARTPLLPASGNHGKRKRGVTAQLAQSVPNKRQQTSPALPTSTDLIERKQTPTGKAKEQASAQTKPRITSKSRKMVDQGINMNTGARKSARERKPTDKVREDQERQGQEMASSTKSAGTGPVKQSAQLTVRSGSHALSSDLPLFASTSMLQGDLSILQSNQRLPPSSLASLSNADNVGRPFSSPGKSSDSPNKRSGSPKKGDRTLGKPKTDGSIRISDLARFVPAVCFGVNIKDIIGHMGHIPEPVALLRERLSDKPGYIPHTLRDYYRHVYSTPTKSKGILHGDPFQSTFANEDEDSICLKKEVEYVMNTADWNYQSGAHERQWGSTTINPILNAAARLHGSGVKLLNLESCSIQPIELRPERHEGGKIDLETESTHSNDTTKTSQSLTTSRMIDYGFGLGLSFSNRRTIDDAFSCLEDSKRSLNQSLAYQDNVPLFADIEIKKTHSERAPEVQLGVWQAAGYLKRKLHGWSTLAMPMPGICVNGHDWVAYITFESAEDNLVAIGPIEMGNTRSIPGIWQILYKLDQLLSWGESEYKGWFETEVMAWAKKLAADG